MPKPILQICEYEFGDFRLNKKADITCNTTIQMLALYHGIFKKVLSILILLCLFVQSKTQTVATIEHMAEEHRKCLDTGVNMLGCSRYFYFQMDSLLNVVYKKIKISLSFTDKEILRKEQFSWLNKRDIYFKKQDKIFQDNYKKGRMGHGYGNGNLR